MNIFSQNSNSIKSPLGVWKDIKREGVRGFFSRCIRQEIPHRTGIPILQFCKVNPHLYMGPRLSHLGKVLLEFQGFGCCVNMREDFDDTGNGVAFKDYCYPPDFDGSDIDKLEFGVAYIDQKIKAGKKVYVHCNHGLHSAPLMVAAYFISKGYSVDEALDLINKINPRVYIYPIPMEYLKLYAKTTWQELNNEARTQEEKISAEWAFLAHQKYKAGNYAGAVIDFQKAVQIAPNFPALYRNWAIMESHAGFFEKAEISIKKATDLDPDNLCSWLVWGNIEKHRGLLDRAYVYFEKALDISGNNLYVLGNLAAIEKQRGNYKNADTLLMKVLDLELNDYLLNACYTYLADNLRIWSNSLTNQVNNNSEEVLEKLNRAYVFTVKAIDIKKTIRALDCFRDVCLDTAIFICKKDGVESARPYFEKSIVMNPIRAKDKLRTALAYHELAKGLDIEGKQRSSGISHPQAQIPS